MKPSHKDESYDLDDCDGPGVSFEEWVLALSAPTRAALLDQGVTQNSAEETLMQRLERIEHSLAELVRQRTVKEWYGTAELAELLAKAEYTVREWCRQGRILAVKKPCGRGKAGEWLVSHEELTRLRNEGLRPFPKHPK